MPPDASLVAMMVIPVIDTVTWTCVQIMFWFKLSGSRMFLEFVDCWGFSLKSPLNIELTSIIECAPKSHVGKIKQRLLIVIVMS